jgi:hypothetical protein
MMIAARYVYNASKDNIKEAEQKRQWRKTFDPNYVSRRSTLAEIPRKLKRESIGRLSMMLGSRYATTIYSQLSWKWKLIYESRHSLMMQKPERSYMKRSSEEFDEPELRAKHGNGFVKL